MQILKGQHYTFIFTPSGIDLSGPFSEQGTAVIKSLVDAGFPLGNPTWSQGGTGLGYLIVGQIAVSFTYNGTETDDSSLGEAMQNQLNSDFTLSSFNYENAEAGDVPASGSPTEIAKSVPSLPTLGIGALAIVVLLVAVFAFSESVGARVGA